MNMIIERQSNINEEEVFKIEKQYGVSKNLAKFLVGRNLSNKIIKALLGDYVLPKHNNITNLEEGAMLIASYLEKENGAIYVYADYDSDGVNSGFIASDCLTKLKEALNSKCHVEVYFPNRCDGYGLSLEWCKKLVDRNKEEKKDILVITVDNGITKKVESEYLLKNNIEVLITDHHYPKKDEVPEDVLVINPWLHKDTESFGLCGAGVTYKLFAYLLEDIYKDESNYHLYYLPNVTIATVTDMMPLTVENIQYMKYGFYLIENDHCSKGISYYKERKNINYLSTKEIAFSLGPQLNACGRMSKTELAGQFLLEEDEDNVADSYRLMSKINDERKKFQNDLLEEIESNLNIKEDTRFIIAHNDNIGGVGGIIAGKLVEKYKIPCMVLGGSNNLLHGSARSTGGLDLHKLFEEEVSKGNILNFGGHKEAAGIEIDKNKIPKLQESLDERLKDFVYEESTLISDIIVDELITLRDLNKDRHDMTKDIPLIGDLANHLYAIKGLKVLSTKKSKNNPNHICLSVTDGTTTKNIWAWNLYDKFMDLPNHEEISLIGSIVVDFMNPNCYTFNIEQIIN